jgi:hypothetical protein
VRSLTECAESWVVSSLQLGDSGAHVAADRREDEDAALGATHARERREERRTMGRISGVACWG